MVAFRYTQRSTALKSQNGPQERRRSLYRERILENWGAYIRLSSASLLGRVDPEVRRQGRRGGHVGVGGQAADLIGEGRLLKLGKTLAVGDFTIWSDGRADPVAHATTLQAVDAGERRF